MMSLSLYVMVQVLKCQKTVRVRVVKILETIILGNHSTLFLRKSF